MKIIPLREVHLEEAASLVSHRYQRLCERVPRLPTRYSEIDILLPLLKNILASSGTGVAAVRENRMVGFLTSWQMPSFRGKRSVYSPEWANAADLEDSARIYEAMYSQLAAGWVADKYTAHYISLFPNDTDALRALHWLGFGMFAIDALRGLEAIPGDQANIRIQRAEAKDIEQVVELHEDLRQYMKSAPVFFLSDPHDRSYYQEWLQSPDKVVWLAYWKEEPVAMMRLGPADEDVCTIIVDEKTTSIYSAFTKEETRREGVASALLDRALQSARDSGYVRCAVPFEPMNLLGTRFWLKYFDPVCFSVLRTIDERLVD